MCIYIFLLLIISIAAFLIKNRVFSNFCITLLLFVAIFRDESVGIDTTNYVHEGFSLWASGMRSNEFIYQFLTSFIPPGGSYLLVIVFGLTTTGCLYTASKRFGIEPILTFFFFILFEYFNLSLNIARQYAAIGLLLVGYSYLFESTKKKYCFFLYIFLACGFHSSSILFVLIYPLKVLDLSKIDKRVLIIIIFTIFTLLKFVIADYYLIWISTIELFQDIEVYAKYFEQATVNDLSINGLILSIASLLLNIYILINLSQDESKEGRIIANLLLFSVIADIFFSGLWGNIGRLRYSINIINVIAFSHYYLKRNDTLKPVVIIGVCLFYGYELIYSLVGTEHAYGTVPYKLNF